MDPLRLRAAASRAWPFVASGLIAALGGGAVLPAGAAPAAESGSAAEPRAPTLGELLRGLDPLAQRVEGDRLVSPLGGGNTAVLTLDPGLQAAAEGVFERYEVPYAGLVAVRPETGRLLAYVSHSTADPQGTVDWARDASAPAASVFKLITSAALLEHGLTPHSTTCYHGGYSGIEAGHLRDDEKLDTACASFKNALGFSINAVFAKRAVRHLEPRDLRRYASAFGFGHALPFDVRAEPSRFDVPAHDLEFARAAAGFWHSHMSPLHGAMIAATIANRGRMMRPRLVAEVRDRAGRVLARRGPELFRSVLERRTAELLADMMTATVDKGTAHGTFFDPAGNAFLPGIEVAGKTGTLSRERPYRGYTWWVGFAPAQRPEIAVAALVVNSPKWRIKATYAAREALRYYLVERPRAQRTAATPAPPGPPRRSARLP